MSSYVAGQTRLDMLTYDLIFHSYVKNSACFREFTLPAKKISTPKLCLQLETALRESYQGGFWASLVTSSECFIYLLWLAGKAGLPGGSVVKNLPANAGAAADMDSIPRSGRSRKRKWQPTPVSLPGKFLGQRSLIGYNPWGHKESDTTENTHTALQSLTLSGS